jgi:demethylmenaquinone methyltransferase/2-methoxy-6-polyprenyl-1,4-benzoquinol methylase
MNLDDLLAEQIAYYRARAPEYDQWFLRQGRYDRGPEVNAAWFREVAEVRKAVESWAPRGHVLELAAGTGLWTEQLASLVDHVTAVDASPEVLALNRERVGTSSVTHVQADLFSWEPPRRYDAVFFAFWLSHVPPDRFGEFFGLVERSLVEGGSVFFVDSRFTPLSTAKDHEIPEDDGVVTRRLEDGREFRVVKRFYDAGELERALTGMGWRSGVKETATFFLHGTAELRSSAAE